jgi:hypothetical protein
VRLLDFNCYQLGYETLCQQAGDVTKDIPNAVEGR